MDRRVRLIQDYEEGESISALAGIYGVARKTIYQWLGRHDTEGVAGLAGRSRAPLGCPTKVSDEMVAHIVAARLDQLEAALFAVGKHLSLAIQDAA
jgi:transposase